ncbi:hypothetical protein AM493_08265 [Flavobacterium akiainvivens]|uniref:Lipocalin-like domain-containing protein n=1 Tax=Flavobacterium akiainvivens TaxID=1202724 RepID=A0A0M9VI49_9FLAO|nr:lipocalin family protein [Flavobacterium akiainvivens]KOS06032.1 hypothetical protein AM493_08265 [Flavobacterium akiainvivens]SFQ54387.1 hypothetical protein SAMN05444144_107135 [Flavobacterium akiainvivens]
MTKIKFYIVFILTFLLASCSSDDAMETLEGTWKLKNATVPEGANIQYTDGEVSWTFSQDNQRLTVQNNIMTAGPENIFSGLPSGSYTFYINNDNGNKTLYVEGIDQGIFAYTDANLVINSEADANGVIKVFGR